MVLGPGWVRRAEPEQARKGAAWSELRVVVLAKQAAEAHEADPFLEKAAGKPIFPVKRGESEDQVKLEL
jgi:hypothetical protein